MADLVRQGEVRGEFVVLEWEALVAFRAAHASPKATQGGLRPMVQRLLTTAVTTVKRAVTGQAVLTDPEARLRVCFTCPDRNGKRCGLCGCFLAAKTRMAGERCPAGLW